MHNTTTGQSASMQVNFPKTQNQDIGGANAKYSLNGYYDKDAASLKNGF